MQRRKISLFLLFTLILFAISPVYAVTLAPPVLVPTGDPLHQHEISGQWLNYTGNYIATPQGTSDNFGRANFTFGDVGTINDTQGFECLMAINITVPRGPIPGYDYAKRFYIAFELTDGTESHFALFYVAKDQGPILASKEMRVGENLSAQFTGWRDTPNVPFAVQIVRSNSTLMDIYAGYWGTNLTPGDIALMAIGGWPLVGISKIITDNATWAYRENQTVSADFFNHNLTINMYMGHDGFGTVQAALTYNLGAITLSHNTFFGNTPGGNFIAGIWNFIVSVISMVIAVGRMLIGFLGVIWPLLPMIALLYVIDAGIESVNQGSIQPVGSLFMWIWSTFITVVQTIISALQAIGNAVGGALGSILGFLGL